MEKIIIISFLILALLGFNIYSSAKKSIENSQAKKEKIYAELGIQF